MSIWSYLDICSRVGIFSDFQIKIRQTDIVSISYNLYKKYNLIKISYLVLLNICLYFKIGSMSKLLEEIIQEAKDPSIKMMLDKISGSIEGDPEKEKSLEFTKKTLNGSTGTVLCNSIIEYAKDHIIAILKKTKEKALEERLSHIPLYKNRPNKNMNSIEFVETYYRDLIEEKLIYTNILRKIDIRLINKLYEDCKQENLRVNSIVPTSEDRVDEEVKQYRIKGSKYIKSDLDGSYKNTARVKVNTRNRKSKKAA